MEYSFDKMIERLKIFKKERKLTNEQLSNLSGVPFGTLNKILGSETKETNISTVIKLANAIGVPAEKLIFGTEPAPKDNITHHERDIINAYREQPESVQEAICRMLKIDYPVSEIQAKKIV